MSQDEISRVERPHKHFETPKEVVLDPALSKEEKLQALDHLEQDARQLAVASSKGMSGGEDTKLHEVLAAKDALECLGTRVDHGFDDVPVYVQFHLPHCNGLCERIARLNVEKASARYAPVSS